MLICHHFSDTSPSSSCASRRVDGWRGGRNGQEKPGLVSKEHLRLITLPLDLFQMTVMEEGINQHTWSLIIIYWFVLLDLSLKRLIRHQLEQAVNYQSVFWQFLSTKNFKKPYTSISSLLSDFFYSSVSNAPRGLSVVNWHLSAAQGRPQINNQSRVFFTSADKGRRENRQATCVSTPQHLSVLLPRSIFIAQLIIYRCRKARSCPHSGFLECLLYFCAKTPQFTQCFQDSAYL